jgi:hypothetical protein
MKSWWPKFRASILELSARQIALLLIVGFVLGVFPLPGFPTLFCALAAFALRLNIPALQLLNNVTSPLQLALWLPLSRIGAWISGKAVLPIAGNMAAAAWHAVLGWACICIPFGVALYVTVELLLARRKPRPVFQ